MLPNVEKQNKKGCPYRCEVIVDWWIIRCALNAITYFLIGETDGDVTPSSVEGGEGNMELSREVCRH